MNTEQDEYTPTTEYVKAIWAIASPNRGMSVPERELAFTRWLAAELATARQEAFDEAEKAVLKLARQFYGGTTTDISNDEIRTGEFGGDQSIYMAVSHAANTIRATGNSPTDTDHPRVSVAASIVSFIESKRAELRIFPDIWAADLAARLGEPHLEGVHRDTRTDIECQPMSDPVHTEELDYMTDLNAARRHEIVEGAVDAIEMNATNRTAAYNTWNNLATDERFVRAILTFRAVDLGHKIAERDASIEAVRKYIDGGFRTIGVDEQTEYQGSPETVGYVPAQGILDLLTPGSRIIARPGDHDIEGAPTS